MKPDVNKKHLFSGKTLAGILISALAFQIFAESTAKGNPKGTMLSIGSPNQISSGRDQAWEMRNRPSPMAAPWESVGPYGIGRQSSVAVVPGQGGGSDTVYFGAANGGVRKSTDNGVTFKDIWPATMKSQSIGTIAIAKSNSQILYVGGGENYSGGGGMTYPGDGVHKSTDGGKTWTRMGIDSTFFVGSIAIHPTNPDIVFVGVLGDLFQHGGSGRGVWRTKNGGTTWTKILGPGLQGIPITDDSTGAAQIIFKPDAPDSLFVTMWTTMRHPYDQNFSGNSCRIWRSQNGGDTWTRLGHTNDLPEVDLGKAALDIAETQPNTMYMVYLNGDYSLKSVYKSPNGGENWVNVGANINGDSLFGYQTVVQIKVNPSDPKSVFLFGGYLSETGNGGSKWTINSNAAYSRITSLGFGATNRRYIGSKSDIRILEAGLPPWGQVRSGPKTGMDNNYSEIYSFDIDPTNENRRIVGLRGGGVWMTKASGDITSIDGWVNVVGGEGSSATFDHGEPANWIGCSAYFVCSGSAGYYTKTGRGGWETPVAIDRVTGNAYLAGSILSRASRGNSANTQLGSDLSNGDHSIAGIIHGVGTALDAFNDIAYIGTDDGNLWVAKSGVLTQLKNGATGGPGNCKECQFDGWYKGIWIDKTVTDGSTFYLAKNWHRWGTRNWKPAIWKVTHFGASPGDYLEIQGDLPPGVNTNKVMVDHGLGRMGWIYVSTDLGMYMSTNGGVNYSWMGGQELPSMPISDMEFFPATSPTGQYTRLYVVTFGRGIFRIDLSGGTSIKDKTGMQSSKTQRLNNFPNPVLTSTQIQFQIEKKQNLHVALYNMQGSVVATLYDKEAEAGKPYTLQWNRTNSQGGRVRAGEYILRAVGVDVTMAHKVIVQ